MLKSNYESNACLLLETDLRWLGLLRRALKSGLWPVMITRLIIYSEIAFVILEHFRETMFSILLGDLARSSKFEAFEIISCEIELVFSTMEHDMRELFCCLAGDSNYHDEKLCNINFKSGLYYTRQNIVFKALGCF